MSHLPWILALLAAAPGAPDAGSPGAPRCQEVKSGFGERGETRLHAEIVVSGLEVPWSLGFLPGGDWLVTERPGRLRLIRAGKLQPDPVATVAVDPGGEGGLQGLAVDPDFAHNRRIYLYFTTLDGKAKINRLERWLLAEDHRSAKLDKRLLDQLPAAQYHHGGRIRFGPDGMLYVSVGDGRRPERAADPSALNGKLLRLTPDGAVPPGNPDPKSPIWIRGVRNSEGFDWLDAGTLVITDHGPTGDVKGWTGADEVNLAHRGDDLGWPRVHLCDELAGTVTPLLTWDQAVPPGGAAIYTGERLRGWKGSLVMGTLGSKHLHRVVFADGRVARHEVYLAGDRPDGLGRIREVVMGPDRELYVTTSNCDGRGSCPPDKDVIARITAD